MSRTDKDIPFFVKELYAFQDGKIHHDHTPKDSYERRVKNTESMKKFLPHEKRKIAEYAEKLRKDGHEPQIEETTEFKYNLYSAYRYLIDDYFDDFYNDVNYYKKIVIVYHYDYITIEQRYSNECTTAEFYDHNTGTDKRDGKRVSCYADIENYKQRHKCSKNEISRRKVKQSLKKVQKNLNNLDDFAYEPELTMKYGKKIYTC